MTAVHLMSTAADSAVDPARHRKLCDAAQQFEGMFLQQLLKSKGVDGEDADADGDSSVSGGMYKDFGNEFVAKSIAQAGGLGIARRIVAQVEKTLPKNISVQR